MLEQEEEYYIKIERLEAEEDLQTVLNIKQGRALLSRIIDMCGVFDTCHREQELLQYHNGRRDIGVKLISMVLDANKDSYLEMQKEAFARQERYEGLRDDEAEKLDKIGEGNGGTISTDYDPTDGHN